MEKYNFIVSGTVQGVGFRYFVLNSAKKLDIYGQVWNNDDGTVEILAQGTSSNLTKFESEIRQGPKLSPFAKVTYLDKKTANFKDFTDFTVTY